MKINKKKKLVDKKRVAACLIILFAIISAILYKNGTYTTVNISNSQTPNTNKTNDIVEALVEDNNTPTIPQDNSSSIEISVTAAYQDSKRGPLIIRTLVNGIDGGTCVYSISKQDLTKKYESEVLFTGKYYSCNYDINFSDLSLGTWNLNIGVIKGNKKGNLTRDVTIE